MRRNIVSSSANTMRTGRSPSLKGSTAPREAAERSAAEARENPLPVELRPEDGLAVPHTFVVGPGTTADGRDAELVVIDVRLR